MRHTDSFVNKEKRHIWKTHMERASFWDMLLMRHIPDLRSARQSHGF